MNVYYQKCKKRLVYFNSAATPEYWDEHWNKNPKVFKNLYKDNTYVSELAKKYINHRGTIVEGGCGRANHVYSLSKNGFRSIGIDYAKKTVDHVNNYLPDLDVRLGDVQKLDLKSNSIDGYFSLGVIEHFFDGYGQISNEMSRVLKSGGFLFITIPTMSNLRKLKAYFGAYDNFNNNSSEGFYQFALDSDQVVESFIEKGFKLIKKSNKNGYKGFKDEAPHFLKYFLQYIYDSNFFCFKALRVILDKILSSTCGHISLIILQKK